MVIVRLFAPVGHYAGHWGIDLAVSDIGTDVQAIGGGTVSFAGSVAGRKSVTIDHGGGIRTSYSYLSNIFVSTGRSVTRGATIGSSGVHDARNAFHLSLRSGSTYLDPLGLGRCSSVPEPGLWLTDVRGG
jgi:murein DD-endopeptidase MepM/ murein hydrolase activator NlpD